MEEAKNKGMLADNVRLEKLKNDYKEYYKNYSLLVTMGIIWLCSAFAANIEIQLSILVLFSGITLFKPVLFLTTKILGAPNIHKDESLKLLTKLIIIGIIFGLIVGFFPFHENINFFFPAFSIVFGFIFAAISATSGLKTYFTVAALLIAGGAYTGYYYPEEFTPCGYFAGYVMTGMGIINGIIGRRSQIAFRFLRKKTKFNINPLVKNSTKVDLSKTTVRNKVLKMNQ